MPVHVHVPTRVRVDGLTLRDRWEEVEESLVGASVRALRASVAETLDPREGYVGVRLHPPTVTWLGPGANDVPVAVRASLERRLAELFRASAETSGLLAAGTRGESAPTPVPPGAAEPVDSTRLAEAVDAYGVPSYDGPRQRAVRVHRRRPPATELVTDWLATRSPEQVIRAALREIETQGISIPTTGYLGVIHRRGGRPFIEVWRFPEDRIAFSMRAERDPHTWDLRPDGTPVPVVAPPPADVPYHVERIGQSTNRDQARAVYLDFYGSELDFRVRNALRTNMGPLANATVDEIRTFVDGRIAEIVEAMMGTGSYDRQLNYLRLRGGGQQWLVTTPLDVPADLDADLIPLVRRFRRRVTAPATGPGGEGGGGGEQGEGGEGEEARAGEGEGREAGARGEEGLPAFAYGEEPRGGRMFPVTPDAAVWTQTCTPFLGEPSIDELGSDGDRLRQQIDEIAHLLQMQPCEYAGRFALDAALAIQFRALQVGSFAVDERAQTLPSQGRQGNLGGLVFVPVASPSVQLLRHLASVVPVLMRMARGLPDIYERHAEKIQGTWQGRSTSWVIRFFPELTSILNPAIGVLFATACRVLMIQLLRASHREITQRIGNQAYAQFFENALLPQLRDLEELKRLRNQLREELPSSVLADVGGFLYENWRDARRAVVDALEGRDPFPGEYRGPAGTIVREGTTVGIMDSRGTVWTIGELDWIVETREATVAEQDSLVKQVIDDHTLSRRFLLPGASIQRELAALLEEMRNSNEATTREVADSWIYAFRASQISESYSGATVMGTTYALRGIHLEAHNQIGEFFRGDYAYASGLDYLFGSEVARQQLGAFLEFAGLVLLAVVFPPAAVVAGIGTGLYHHAEARERERIFRSLIDPEKVLTRVEVEAELFASELSLVLSFIPAGGAIFRGASAVGRSVARRGVAGGAQLFVRYASRRITRQMMHQLERGFIYALAREVVEEQFEDLIIGKLLIEPAIDQLRLEFMGATQRAR